MRRYKLRATYHLSRGQITAPFGARTRARTRRIRRCLCVDSKANSSQTTYLRAAQRLAALRGAFTSTVVSTPDRALSIQLSRAAPECQSHPVLDTCMIATCRSPNFRFMNRPLLYPRFEFIPAYLQPGEILQNSTAFVHHVPTLCSQVDGIVRTSRGHWKLLRRPRLEA